MKWLSRQRTLLICTLPACLLWIALDTFPGAGAQDVSAIKVIPKFDMPAPDRLCPAGFSTRGEGSRYVCERQVRPSCYPTHNESGLRLDGDRVSYRCDAQGLADLPRTPECAPGFLAAGTGKSSYVCEMSIQRICYTAYERISELELDTLRLYYVCESSANR